VTESSSPYLHGFSPVEQARLISRLRLVLAGAVVLLLLAVAGAGVAVFQWDRAGDNAAAAAASEVRAVARRAGASALATGDIDTSLLLAVAGVRLDPSTSTANALIAAIGKRPELFASTPIEGDLPLAIDASADGRFLAILDESRHLRLYDAGTGELLADRQEGEPLVTFRQRVGDEVAFSPDGRWLAVARTPDRGRPLDLLSVPALEPAPWLRGLPPRGWHVTDLSFSGDGGRLAAGLERAEQTTSDPSGGAALVWDLGSRAAPRRFRFGTTVTPQVALDRRGGILYTSHPLTRWSLDTGVSRVLVPREWIWSMSLLPGSDDVIAIENNTPVVLDGTTGEVRHRYTSDGSFLVSLRAAPNGRRFIATVSEQREVRQWQVRHPDEPPRTVSLDRGNPNAVGYSADGSFLFASGRGGTAVRRWDLTGTRGYVRTVRSPSYPGGQFGVMAADGQRSVVLADGGWVITDYRSGTVGVIPEQEGYRHTYGAFHPDGHHFATAAGTRVRVWDGDGRPTGQRAVFASGQISELDYTPDGSRLVVAELDGTVTLLDGNSLEQTGTPVDLGEPVSWVVARPDGRTAVVLLGDVEASGDFVVPSRGWALVDLVDGIVVRRGALQMRYSHWLDVSPDGRLAVVGGGEYGDGSQAGDRAKVEVLDLSTGRLVAPVREWGGNPRSQVVFSPDGTQLLSSSPNGLVAVWDASTVTPTYSMALPQAGSASGAFLPDGRTARFLDWYGAVAYDWDLSSASAVAFACGAVGRDLTREEWIANFGDLPYRETCPQ